MSFLPSVSKEAAEYKLILFAKPIQYLLLIYLKKRKIILNSHFCKMIFFLLHLCGELCYMWLLCPCFFITLLITINQFCSAWSSGILHRLVLILAQEHAKNSLLCTHASLQMSKMHITIYDITATKYLSG